MATAIEPTRADRRHTGPESVNLRVASVEALRGSKAGVGHGHALADITDAGALAGKHQDQIAEDTPADSAATTLL